MKSHGTLRLMGAVRGCGDTSRASGVHGRRRRPNVNNADNFREMNHRVEESYNECNFRLLCNKAHNKASNGDESEQRVFLQTSCGPTGTSVRGLRSFTLTASTTYLGHLGRSALSTGCDSLHRHAMRRGSTIIGWHNVLGWVARVSRSVGGLRGIKTFCHDAHRVTMGCLYKAPSLGN